MKTLVITEDSLKAAKWEAIESIQNASFCKASVIDAFAVFAAYLCVPAPVEAEGWVMDTPGIRFHKGRYSLRYLGTTKWELYWGDNTGQTSISQLIGSSNQTEAQAWANREIARIAEGRAPKQPIPIAPGARYRLNGDELVVVTDRYPFFYAVNITKGDLMRIMPDSTYGCKNIDALHAALIAAGAEHVG